MLEVGQHPTGLLVVWSAWLVLMLMVPRHLLATQVPHLSLKVQLRFLGAAAVSSVKVVVWMSRMVGSGDLGLAHAGAAGVVPPLAMPMQGAEDSVSANSSAPASAL